MRAPRALDREAVDLLRRPVQPLGVRSTIIGHRGRADEPRIDASSVERVVERRRERLVHRLRLAPLDEERPVAVPVEEREELLLRDPGEHGRVRDLVAVRCRIGSTAPSRRGLRNLLPCHPVASGPVSASPSPTTHATTRSGLSNAAPCAWRARSRARRPRGSSRASRARRGSGSRPGTRTAGRACAAPPRRGRRASRARCTCPRGTRSRPSRAAVPRAADVDHAQVARADRAVQVRVDEVEARASSRSGRAAAASRARPGAARAGAGSRAGRSAPPRGSWRPAVASSRRSSSGASGPSVVRVASTAIPAYLA